MHVWPGWSLACPLYQDSCKHISLFVLCIVFKEGRTEQSRTFQCNKEINSRKQPFQVKSNVFFTSPCFEAMTGCLFWDCVRAQIYSAECFGSRKQSKEDTGECHHRLSACRHASGFHLERAGGGHSPRAGRAGCTSSSFTHCRESWLQCTHSEFRRIVMRSHSCSWNA